MNLPDLSGQFVILTGAAQGLGAAIALAYARHAMRVALLDVKADLLAQVAEQSRALGGECLPIPVDLSDAEATQAAAQQAIAHFGTPRALIHNAAILNVKPFMEISLREWVRENNVITQAAFLLSQAVWPHMAQAGRGSIVFLSSGSGIKGFVGESAYCTGKHGQEGLMKCLALEGEPLNIAVNTMTPGAPIHTPMSEQNYTPDQKAKWIDPALLTPAFVYAAGLEARSGVTGQRLNAWELAVRLDRNAGR